MGRPDSPLRVVLGVTGSVAAVRTPALAAALRDHGAEVRVVATEPALSFFEPAELPPGCPLYRDRDEWPDRLYRRGDPVLHVAFRDWADLLLVAPLDANTLGKFALGLSDNFLTCLYRAWIPGRPVILAPAMNTRMWESPVTRRHFRLLLEDWGDGGHPAAFDLDDVPALFARHAPRHVIIPPQAKLLACGDFGMGAMAEVPAIAEVVRSGMAEACAPLPDEDGLPNP
jgi:phosphopantothenoylcysteine decarboxylase